MKQPFFLRAVCLMLICGILLCFAGCHDAPSQEAPQTRLHVETEAVSYTQAFSQDVTPRAVELLFRLIRIMGGPQATDEEREAARTRVQQDLFRSTLRANITQQELEQILSFTQQYCEEAEAATTDKNAFLAFCRFYQSVVGLIGTTRAGMLTFDGCHLYLTNRIVVCEQRYAQYGYSWYLEDANRYRGQLAALGQELQESTFSDAISVFVVLGSFLTGVLPNEISQKSALLYDAELLQILQMQADRFARLDVTPRQWYLMADILSDIRARSADTALSAQLGVMQKSKQSAALAQSMPAFLCLYRATLHHIDEQGISLLRADATRAQQSGVICEALSHCEAEFLSFTAQLEPLLHTDGVAEQKELKRLGLSQDFEHFLANTVCVDAHALFDVISAYTDTQDTTALRSASLSYLRTHAPHLAYALSTALTKE